MQIVPELQKIAGAKVGVFVRQKTWITNRFGQHIMAEMGWEASQLESKNLLIPGPSRST